MSYRYDNQQKKRRLRVLAGATILLLVLFTPLYARVFDFLERPFARAWENKNNILSSGGNFFSSFYGKTQILAENKDLKRKIERLEVDNLRTKYLADQLDVVSGYQQSDLRPSAIISGGVIGSLDSLIIAHKDDQFGVGDGVYIADHVLIGFISSVFDTTARVTLYTEKQQQKEGVLFPHNVNLVAKGQGSRSMTIDVPREIPVAVGDIFYDLAQPGNIIGVIQDIQFDPRDPFQKAYLGYPVNINNHQIVGVKNNLK